jgi:hypothetical protein
VSSVKVIGPQRSSQGPQSHSSLGIHNNLKNQDLVKAMILAGDLGEDGTASDVASVN